MVEVSRQHSPTGERFVTKPYPKDDEPRVIRVTAELTDAISQHVQTLRLGPNDLLFTQTATADGGPLSRNNFRSKEWLPAVARAGLGHVRFHDLRHAHASWALAGGADLKAVMDRMGHTQITTTQRYLHRLPEADEQALASFTAVRQRVRAGRSLA
jgi:integrase